MNKPQLQTIEQLSDGWIKKYVLTYEMSDGAKHSYEVASRKSLEDYQRLLEINGTGGSAPSPDAVCIVARTPRNSLVMIREFRYPLNSWCIAFPAGLVDAGEEPVECACRELQEETGYVVDQNAPIRVLEQAGYSSTGMSDESVLIVFVEAERAGSAHTEEHELIEVFELPIHEVDSFLARNKDPIGTRAQLILESFRAQV